MAVTSSISAPASSMVAGATESVFDLRPLAHFGQRHLVHQHVVHALVQAALSTPTPLVALPWGSRSIRRTRAPSTAK